MYPEMPNPQRKTLPVLSLESRASLLGSVRDPTDIGASDHSNEDQTLQEEPHPASTLLGPLVSLRRLCAYPRFVGAAGARAVGVRGVEVISCDADDVVVVCEGLVSTG